MIASWIQQIGRDITQFVEHFLLPVVSNAHFNRPSQEHGVPEGIQIDWHWRLVHDRHISSYRRSLRLRVQMELSCLWQSISALSQMEPVHETTTQC